MKENQFHWSCLSIELYGIKRSVPKPIVNDFLTTFRLQIIYLIDIDMAFHSVLYTYLINDCVLSVENNTSRWNSFPSMDVYAAVTFIKYIK